jgi:amidase
MGDIDSVLLRSAGEQAAAIRSGGLKPSELLDAVLARIDEVNPVINAVVTLDVDAARRQAAARDEEAVDGAFRGPLHGLPITVKDAHEVAGLRSTGGARELAENVPRVDAPAVARLRRAGAVIIGKTNVPRWSGDGQTYNDLFGVTNNPWDTSRTPGGSSGGAAAAVVTGCTSFELGTDIGGSIRQPSAFSGACGHKPSYGIVPQRGYLDHVGGGTSDADINVVGPIARSVEDLEMVLDVVAGPLDADAAAWSLHVPRARRVDAAGARVGVWAEDPALPTSAAVTAAVREAADTLADAGAQVSEDRPALSGAEGVALFEQLIIAAVSPSLDRELAEAVSGTHLAWLEAQEQREALVTAWRRYFADHDILLCPVAPVVAFAHDTDGDLTDRTLLIDGRTESMMALFKWTGLIGVVGLPSTVVPVATTAEGLPIGVQVVGPRLEDRTPLAVARHLLALRGGWRPPPLVS